MAKIGRNAPCPCGSSKKYKKCCMMKRQAESLTRSLVHRKIDELIPRILEYAKQTCPEDALLDAWDDFIGLEYDLEESPYGDMFIKWFLFLWIPEEAVDFDETANYPSPHTIGAGFLKANRSKVDSLSARVLAAALADPLSFWRVEAVEANRGVLVRDLLLGRERFVEDLLGAQHLKKWDIILANTLELDGVHVFNISGPFSLPAKVKATLKGAFALDPKAPEAIARLFEFDLDLLMFYQDVIDELFAASMPELRNMDGKELIVTQSVYTLDPAVRDEIVLSLSETESFEPVDDRTSGDEFMWTAAPEKPSPLEKVIKGILKIGEDKLTTECNSAERDHQLRKVLQNRLAGRITHQQTISEPMGVTKPPDTDPDKITAPLNLDELPAEVRDQMIEQLESLYLNWADQSVPALDHQTPRQAVKSAEGREKVIDLINHWDNQIAHMEAPQYRFDFNRLRGDLGLPLE